MTEQKKGFTPKLVDTPPTPPEPTQSTAPQQTQPQQAAGGIGNVFKQILDKITQLETNLQNIFGFMECKSNTLLRVLVDKNLITIDEFNALFKEENKKVLEQFEAVTDVVSKRRSSDQPAEMGDWVSVSFVGTIDGVPFQNGSSDKFDFRLGEKQVMDDLQNGIIGKKMGEEFEIPVKFPENYIGKEVAGKMANFKVKLLSVKKPLKEEA